MANHQITVNEIRILIMNVNKLSLDTLVKTVNILRPLKDFLPEIELRLLERVESEIKLRNK